MRNTGTRVPDEHLLDPCSLPTAPPLPRSTVHLAVSVGSPGDRPDVPVRRAVCPMLELVLPEHRHRHDLVIAGAHL